MFWEGQGQHGPFTLADFPSLEWGTETRNLASLCSRTNSAGMSNGGMSSTGRNCASIPHTALPEDLSPGLQSLVFEWGNLGGGAEPDSYPMVS